MVRNYSFKRSYQMQSLQHSAAWLPGDLTAAAERWQYTFTDDDLAELTQGLRQIQASKKCVPQFGKDDFPLPQLMKKLAPLKHELEHGLGVAYLTGFPIERFSKDEASAIFWGLGLHFGKPWEQNQRGHLLGDVIDEGRSIEDTSARGYQTTADLDMHTDGADEVGLLCLKQAPVGGDSYIVSGLAVYNHLAETAPDILQHLLNTEFCIDWRDEQPPGDKPYHRANVFERGQDGVVTCFSLVHYIFSAQRHREQYPEIPVLTDFDIKALETFTAATVNPELVFQYRLNAGDMTFLNNHFHLHGRSQFEDAQDISERRHLRRLWLEAGSWNGIRPRAMQNILATARNHWAKDDTTVQMWD
jgi:Taurine catabolism dioxygenase TauD, TfdA family